jgi:hypothetical protein
MIGGRATIFCVGRVGRDRLDSQQREQALYAFVETAVDVIKNRRQGIRCCHYFTVSGAARANACTAMLLLLSNLVMKFVRGALFRTFFNTKQPLPQPKLEPAGLIFQIRTT